MNQRLTHRNHGASEEEQEAVSLTPHQHQHQGQHQAGGPLVFDSVEQLLRHDAGQTPAPPSLTARVLDSIAQETAPARPVASSSPWWKRWLPF